MTWPQMVFFTLAAIGAAGVCLMVAAAVLIIRQGSWQQAIQQPIPQRRWPWSRRLLLAGASLALLFALGVTVLRLVPGGIPWRERPVHERPEGDRAGPASPHVVNPPPVESRPRPQDASSFGEQPAPDFDPKLTLAWPGRPEESRRRINTGKTDETTIYFARFNQDLPLTSFSASVYEVSQQDAQWSDAKSMLAGHSGGGDEVELTRKEIEHGPNKHLGFDLTLKDNSFFVRRVNVLAGRRIYSVQVMSLQPQRLAADDVVKFFESFAVRE